VLVELATKAREHILREVAREAVEDFLSCSLARIEPLVAREFDLIEARALVRFGHDREAGMEWWLWPFFTRLDLFRGLVFITAAIHAHILWLIDRDLEARADAKRLAHILRLILWRGHGRRTPGARSRVLP
jgi:hypothetical protein